MKYEHTVTINDPGQQRFVRARVQMAIETVVAPGVHVSFRRPADARFEAPVAYGVAWAAERVPLAGNRPGLEVTVFFLEYEHLDPSVAIVALFVARCACDSLGVAEARPHFDESQRVVVWPF